MPISTEKFSRDFAKNWGKDYDVSMRNYADHIVVNMRKMAPFLTGALVRGIHAVRRGGQDVPGYCFGVEWSVINFIVIMQKFCFRHIL